MKLWSVALLFVFFTACNNEPKHTVPDALNKKEMPAPIQQLFNKLDQHPDSVGLRLQLVDALDSLGAYQQAMGQMDSLIKKDSLNYGLWYRKAQLQVNTHDTTGALKSYRYAIRIYPAPDAMLAAANLLAEKKDSLALRICKRVDELRMGRISTAHTSFISGVFYARTGNRQKAMDAFNTCIANNFYYMEAYMEKGFLLFDAKKIPEALQVFITLSTVNPVYPDAYYWIAKCYEALNNKPAAISHYGKALVLDPKLKEAGDALKRLGVK